MNRLTALISLLALTVSAQAASIGINLTAPNTRNSEGIENLTIAPTTTLLPSDVTGVVPQGNWNNITGSLDYPDGLQNTFWPDNESTKTGSISSVLDDAGNAQPGMTVAWRIVANWRNQKLADWGSSGAQAKLQTGGYILPSTTVSPIITVTGIPYSEYDVYVYIGANSNPGNGGGTATLDLATGATGEVDTTVASYTWGWPGENFIEGLNYVKFEGNTASGFTLGMSSTNWTALTGLQIVAVPEPASIGLLSFGGLVLLRRKR